MPRASPIRWTAKMRRAFIDVQKINRQVQSGKRRATIQSLALLRRNWRKQIRFTQKKPSRPGQPPRFHRRGLGIRTIFFHYDQATGSGIVGMVKLHGFNSDKTSHKALPGILEAGGTVKNLNRAGNTVSKIAPRPSGGPTIQEAVKTGEVLDPYANLLVK